MGSFYKWKHSFNWISRAYFPVRLNSTNIIIHRNATEMFKRVIERWTKESLKIKRNREMKECRKPKTADKNDIILKCTWEYYAHTHINDIESMRKPRKPAAVVIVVVASVLSPKPYGKSIPNTIYYSRAGDRGGSGDEYGRDFSLLNWYTLYTHQICSNGMNSVTKTEKDKCHGCFLFFRSVHLFVCAC